jgi:hypothetical protein
VSGRAASIERRRALSAGKTALPPAAERVRNGERSAALPPAAGQASAGSATAARPAARLVAVPSAPTSAPATGAAAARAPAASGPHFAGGDCRAQARARRAQLSLHGRGDAPAAPPTRPPREHRSPSGPTAIAFIAPARQSVTSSRVGKGSQVTGVESGADRAVSGTQFISREAGLSAVANGPKVGLARTAHGGVVSGTLIRSKVAITGDEAGGGITITGEAEQRPEDDLTARSDPSAYAAGQFQRQTEPHGQSAHGTNLGRSLRQAGSRTRQRPTPLEATEGGAAITGSSVGGASCVTGDEECACRHVTGDQYMSPARLQPATAMVREPAPAPQPGPVRRDPPTQGMVRAAAAGRSAAAERAVATGDDHGAAAARASRVTGDTPHHDDSVTGTGRGAARSITGTPYYRDAAKATAGAPAAAAAATDAIAAVDAGFSVRSPQRAAQLRAGRDEGGTANGTKNGANRVTGAFAVECSKLTGNLEFAFRPRHAPEQDAKPAHARVSGEGRTAGPRISGDSWADKGNVTGTEGFTPTLRNPSERAGKPHVIAGAAKFKSMAVKDEPKQLVTGMFGWSSNSAAKVTLSGGAHG